MGRLEIVYRDIDTIIAYDNNPRDNEKAVDPVANSIREFGFKVPIIIDSNSVIVAGHTRLKAAKKIGLREIPTVVADDLTDEQIRAFRIADNKVSELADWDIPMLNIELGDISGIDMGQFGFNEYDFDNIYELINSNDKYTMKVDVPHYEIKGDCPNTSDLFDVQKPNKLIKDIECCDDVTDDEKEFLIEAAKRHTVFNYKMIAEYYAHANCSMQKLMEQSGLVIIDVDNAIANGFTKLNNDTCVKWDGSI